MAKTVIWLVLGLAIAGAAWFVLVGSEEEPGGFGFEEVDGAGPETGAGPGLSGRGDAHADASASTGRFRITGRVLDKDKQPVADVPIEVRARGAAWNRKDPGTYNQPLADRIRETVAKLSDPGRERGPVRGRARSGQDGTFALALPASAKYEVTALPIAPAVGTTATVDVHEDKLEAEVVLHIEAGTPLSGRVLDTTDRPIPATISAEWWKIVGGASRTWRGPPTKTNPADGTFELPAVPAGRVTLTLTLASGRRVTGIYVNTPHEGEFVVRLDPSGGVLHGTLTDAQGAAIPEAVLLIRVTRAKDDEQAGGSTTAHTRTDADGRYRIADAPLGTVTRVEALAEGFLPLQQTNRSAPAWKDAKVAAGEAVQLDLTLSRGGSVFGLVRETGTNKPLADAQVVLYRAQGSGPGVGGLRAPTAKTDAEGRYRFDAVDVGRYVAIPSLPGWYLPQLKTKANNVINFSGGGRSAPAELTVLMTEEGSEVERHLGLTQGIALAGRVVDMDGKGVAGAGVHAREYGLAQLAWSWGIRPRQDEPLATSGTGGRFEIPGLPPRPDWMLFARKDGHAGQYGEALALVEGEQPPALKLTLLPGATLRGRVVGLADEEGTLAQVGFWGEGSELSSKQGFQRVTGDGSFELTGVPPGTWTLNLWANGRQGTQKQVTDLKAGEVREGLVLELAEGVEVSGVLVDDEGKPVPNQSINLQSLGGPGGWTSAQTDENGAFTFRGVREGRAQIMVMQAGGTKRLGKPFNTPATDLRIVYAPDPVVTLFGRVLDSDGALVPLAMVQLTKGAQNSPGGDVMMAGGGGSEVLNGQFRITTSGTPPFKVTVSNARDAAGKRLNLRDTTHEISSPETEQVIRLQAGLELRGVVVDPKGQGIADAPVSIGSQRVKTNENGAFVASGLGKGKTSLYVGPVPGYASPPWRQVEPGAQGLRIELQPGLQIKGKVVDADDKPVARGYVSAMWKSTDGSTPGNAHAQLQANGTFTVDGVPDGVVVTLNVQTWSMGGGAGMAPTQVEGVRPGTEDLIVRLGAGLKLEGVVVMPDGKPATACYVGAKATEGSSMGYTGWTQVDEDGAWTLAGLKPIKYEVMVMRQDGGAQPDPTPVEAPASGIRITLPKSASLSGRIAGIGAGEGRQWTVRLISVDGKRNPQVARAEGDGSWSFGAVVAGEQIYVAASRAGDDRYAKVGPIEPGRDDVVLRLQQGRRISGRIDRGGVGEGPLSVSASGGGWIQSGKVEQDGSYVIRGLPPGTYELTAHAHQSGTRVARSDVRDGTSDVLLAMGTAPK